MTSWFRFRCTMALVCGFLALLSGVTTAKTKISFWHSDEGWVYGEALTGLIRQFEASNPDIEVEVRVLVGQDYEGKLVSNIIAGTAPDIAFFNRTRVIERGAQGVLEPLNRYLPAELTASLNPVLLQEVTHKGSTWAVPLSFDIRGLLWNNRLVEEAGLNSRTGPLTMSDLYDWAVKLTRQDDKGVITQLGFYPWGNNWQSMAWFWTFGGEIYNWSTGRPDIVHPKNVQALEWIKTYADRWPLPLVRDFNTRNGNLTKAFTSQTYAVMPGPSAFVSGWRSTLPDLDFGVGRVPHPDGGRNGTWSGGASLVIPSGAKNPKEAAMLMSFLLSEQSQISYFNASYNLPANLRAMGRLGTNDAAMLAFAAQANELNPRPPIWGDFTVLLNGLRDKVMLGTAAPDMGYLEEVQKQLDARADAVGLGI